MSARASRRDPAFAASPQVGARHLSEPSLRHAVANFVVQERRQVVEEQKLLSNFTPFRKGERQGPD